MRKTVRDTMMSFSRVKFVFISQLGLRVPAHV